MNIGPSFFSRLAGKAGHKPAAWPENLGPYTVPYLKRQRSRLITGHILVRGQGEPPDFRRVCIMYNSSYFQRGGANSLTLRQIARAGGDNDDC